MFVKAAGKILLKIFVFQAYLNFMECFQATRFFGSHSVVAAETKRGHFLVPFSVSPSGAKNDFGVIRPPRSGE